MLLSTHATSVFLEEFGKVEVDVRLAIKPAAAMAGTGVSNDVIAAAEA